MYLRALLARTGGDTAFGARRHELVTDALRPGYRLLLRARYDSNERVLARPQPIHHGTTLYEWYSGAADRLALEWHIHGDPQRHQQDRVATQDALSHGRWRRLDRDGRKSPVSWRARWQLRSGRCQDRRGAVEVPDRLWRRR